MAGDEPTPLRLVPVLNAALESALRVDFRGGIRQERPEKNRENPASFKEIVQNLIEARSFRGIFGEFKWRGVIYVLICARHKGPDFSKCALEIERSQSRCGISNYLVGHWGEFI